MGVAALQNLVCAVQSVIAVVRPNDERLARLLEDSGAKITVCENAHEGMGASLACGVRAAQESDGWLVALADMPLIRRGTIRSVARLIEEGAPLAAPIYQGTRGHPVGFGAEFRAELMQLSGDQGARSLLSRNPDKVVLFNCDDPGILQDIDAPQDLKILSRRNPG